ncbi:MULTISPECIES: GntR family transcriptional regulator [unclassified Streptomyces]|uniref:GntR family transcriptional regulator n=1 Tax=unclassified Streptomyces TaxID=2593676 RepID=UPI0036498B39
MSEPSPRGTFLLIAEALRTRIATGTYVEGLPSEAEIGREFGIARTTVRRALGELEESGDVVAVPGVGWQLATGVRLAPYEQIVVDLQKRIREGLLPVGARLPSETELAAAYGVARGTVRRAVRELEAAGYVEARQGVGRFVSPTS